MKESKQYKIFKVVNTIIMIIVILVTLYPFWYLVSLSLSSEKYVYAGLVSLFPRGFTLKTYQVLLAEKEFWTSYKNTIIYTIVGTLVSLFLSTLLAYPLSKKRLKGRGIILGFVVFTMFFSGGLIPTYLLVNALGMRNTIWGVVLPGAVSTFNVMVMKTFFEGIPTELEEAAEVDGMSTYGILLKIILPLSKPIMYVMALFYAVGVWNNWFGPFIYLDDSSKFPVALYLRNILAGAQQTAVSSTSDQSELAQISATLKSASVILTSIPIMMVYPFIQKYFVQGVMIGSLKG
ncbi:carbohydrate ABC transporter permease [Thermoanaerobacterium thermosaccharolyticum]|uniref:Carbohydrate ABC transporter permease n=2 Tax=Thermoanaerobacterium thermosaccharolyticum TaxID=1517 RepID=A0A231VNA6_THETR|nr:carbohydrate ABC transporter permease [Thermoanaerobacterium thermosaccharolyticum]AGB18599.1 ABC-type sugar transport system, permease component [Thermoanaerobacterium thermosaccharolyticum M0795]AST58593.1 sugar ABC transporter permease [Thermoanaerobacterium thermosaccharolyticum]OXT09564.1 carbohydrate ABC transporter permease [Thermoanaerobacterium thermosaccharolyticum]PHO07863.1 sugar ABC transporter permease [Thermoanaerobacterium thermosaccharolyticum]